MSSLALSFVVVVVVVVVVVAAFVVVVAAAFNLNAVFISVYQTDYSACK